MYYVTLSACGNIDHCENPFDNIVNGKRINQYIVECNNIEECILAVNKYIKENFLGSGNWTGGQVFKDGEQVGYISYNRRYWSKGSEYYKNTQQ